MAPVAVAANELGGKKMVGEAHFPQRGLILQGYHGDRSSGDEKMGKGRGGVTTQGLPSSPVGGLCLQACLSKKPLNLFFPRLPICLGG